MMAHTSATVSLQWVGAVAKEQARWIRRPQQKYCCRERDYRFSTHKAASLFHGTVTPGTLYPRLGSGSFCGAAINTLYWWWKQRGRGDAVVCKKERRTWVRLKFRRGRSLAATGLLIDRNEAKGERGKRNREQKRPSSPWYTTHSLPMKPRNRGGGPCVKQERPPRPQTMPRCGHYIPP